jgi:hypothetical protein
MQLTAKEKKIARLALDKAAQPGEREAAAIKLINSLQARGITVEDIEKIREKVVVLKVAVPAPQPTVVRKAPSPSSRSAYTAPRQTPSPSSRSAYTAPKQTPSPSPRPAYTAPKQTPSPSPEPAYTAPKQTPETAEKDIPAWRQVAVLLIVIVGMILLFAGLGRRPPKDSASVQSLPSPERTASAQLSPLPELTALAQVSPSPEPTVRRAQLVTPNETRAKRHPKD